MQIVDQSLYVFEIFVTKLFLNVYYDYFYFKVACPFGTIIEIPWILIDARRPQELTEVER